MGCIRSSAGCARKNTAASPQDVRGSESDLEAGRKARCKRAAAHAWLFRERTPTSRPSTPDGLHSYADRAAGAGADRPALEAPGRLPRTEATPDHPDTARQP